MIGQIVLPQRQRLRGHQRRFTGNRAFFADDQIGLARHALRGEERIPVELRRKRLQLGAGHRVGGRLGVALLLGRPVQLGNRGFERDDPVGLGGRILDPGERLDLDHIIAIGLAEGVIFGPRQQIIIAPRHAQPGLRDIDRVERRIDRVGGDEHRHRAGVAGRPEQAGEVAAGPGGGDPGEVRRQRRPAGALDRRFVHVTAVIIADLLADAAARAGVCGLLVDDRVDVLLDLVVEHRIDPGEGPVGGDLGALVPSAVDEGEEVVARFDGGIGGGQVDPPRRKPRRCGGRWKGQCNRDRGQQQIGNAHQIFSG